MYKAGYRRLLKSAKFAFHGDARGIEIARLNLRAEFQKNANVKDMAELTRLANDIEDIDEMLRFHIVQGARGDSGHFQVGLKEEHLVTVQAHQHLAHGPELDPIEPSFVGRDVTIQKVKGTGVIDNTADVIVK